MFGYLDCAREDLASFDEYYCMLPKFLTNLRSDSSNGHRKQLQEKWSTKRDICRNNYSYFPRLTNVYRRSSEEKKELGGNGTIFLSETVRWRRVLVSKATGNA